MNPNAQKTIKQALKPFVFSGLLPADAWQELQEKILEVGSRAARPDLISRTEAAKLLQVSLRSIINWEREGKIQAIKLAGKRLIRYRMEQVLSLLETSN